ncbi:hypothetical protein LCY76_08715 [Fictibacillus sp. KIGAM418]|uniref:Uncharacterized protein n=1 Tax=Fictibacillus marinisediminis TaxID=2878389 RepID=A0A9X2BDH1_9BACL|nr:hypothetical protein [Fictibacillus marinisediminis]
MRDCCEHCSEHTQCKIYSYLPGTQVFKGL